MEAPKCRLCGKKHWGLCTSPAPARKNDATVIIDSKRIVHPDGRPVVAGDLVVDAEYVVNLNDPQPVLTRAPRGTFDRTAYQREYMRKRRAKAKQP